MAGGTEWERLAVALHLTSLIAISQSRDGSGVFGDQMRSIRYDGAGEARTSLGSAAARPGFGDLLAFSTCTSQCLSDGMIQAPYPRDMIGYGRNPPDPKWPGGALLALNLVLNYEEGGESSVLHGDPESVAFLTEHITTAVPHRAPTAESLWEYGSRVGFWRLWRLLSQRRLPVTAFAVTMAMQRNPEAVAAMTEAGWEIATHGLRWNIKPQESEEGERAEIAATLALHQEITGQKALGWYNRSTARCSTSPIIMPTTCPSGRMSQEGPSCSCPTPSMPMTCASQSRTASPALTNSLPICAIRSTSSTKTVWKGARA